MITINRKSFVFFRACRSMRWTRDPNLYFLLGLMQFAIFLLVAEFLSPDYSVSKNMISDLGVGPEPSRTIFTLSIIAFGLFSLTAGLLYLGGMGKALFPVFIIIAGVGGIGVGICNENTGAPHVLFAFLAFFFSALAALWSYWLLTPPLSLVSLLLGSVSILALILTALHTDLGLGPGGMERLVFYPILLWGLSFAGNRMQSASAAERLKEKRG